MIDITQTIINSMENSRKLAQNQSWEDLKRAREEAIDYYQGDQLKHLKKHMAGIMDFRGDEILWGFSNITKKIINGISLSYLNPPVRKRNKKIDDQYNKWTRDKDRTMLNADRYTSLVDYVGIKVEWNDIKKKYRYRFLKYDVYYELDYTGEDVKAVWYRVDAQGKDTSKHDTMLEYWNNEIRTICDSEGVRSKDLEAYGIKDENNPYGIIPIYIPFKSNTIAHGLIIANKNINAKITEFNELVKYRSFGVPYIIGYDGSTDKIKLSYKYILKVPNPQAKVGMMELKTELRDVIESIKFDIATICEICEVSFNWSIQGDVSGFSLMVQNVGLYDNIKVDNSMRRIWEEGIYDIEMAVGKVKNLPEFTIDFSEYVLPVNKNDQIAWENHQLKNGLTNPVELIRKNNPDLSEKQALKQYDDNLLMMKSNTDASTPEVASTNPFDKL